MTLEQVLEYSHGQLPPQTPERPRGVPRSLVAQQGLDGSEALTCFGGCFHSGKQMATAQNLLALPTPRGPKPWSGTPRVGLEVVRVASIGPGLGLCYSLPDWGGLWELPCEELLSTSVNQGVRGHSVLVLS